jgi:maleylpyruvate isomerase
MKIVLHNYWRSSASTRVRIGLGLKRLPYEYVPVNLLGGAQRAEGYRALNPMAQVPTMEITEDDGTRLTLTQSLAILEYLDERWREPPLLPHDPVARAKARSLAEIVNAGIQPLHNTGVLRRIKKLGSDEQAWSREAIAEGLVAFARVAAETAGAFCVGDAPTIADCCLVPQLFAARRFGVDLAAPDLAQLLAIEARCIALPQVAAALPDLQPDAVKS